MQMLKKIREKGRELKSNVFLLYRGSRDPRMPLHVKILALLIVAYIISPIDIIPDFIPVLGLLDEVILVPIMLAFTVSLIPDEIRQEYQKQDELEIEDQGLVVMGSVMVLLVWSVLIALCVYAFV
ncbi:MAG: YkvA family protein [Gammaproteobacteria bacterium]